MVTLIRREEVRDENRRVLRILIGVMIALAAVAFVTILIKH
jgi:hypothetical protein